MTFFEILSIDDVMKKWFRGKKKAYEKKLEG